MAIAGTAIAIFFATNVKAQTVDKSAWRLGIGIEGGLPTGDIHNTPGWDLGGTARLQYGIDKNVAIMLTSGYYNFFGKKCATKAGGVPGAPPAKPFSTV